MSARRKYFRPFVKGCHVPMVVYVVGLLDTQSTLSGSWIVFGCSVHYPPFDLEVDSFILQLPNKLSGRQVDSRTARERKWGCAPSSSRTSSILLFYNPSGGLKPCLGLDLIDPRPDLVIFKISDKSLTWVDSN